LFILDFGVKYVFGLLTFLEEN